MIASAIAFALVFTLATFSAPTKAQALTTEIEIELVTKGTSGNGVNEDPWGNSYRSISGDGSKVVFSSTATDVIAGMTTTGYSNIFLYDIATASTTLITKGSSGTGGSSASYNPSISADGTKIVFFSWATDLIAGTTTDAASNIFLYDVPSATTTLITTGSSGIGGNLPSQNPKISSDGTRIVFESYANDLIPGETANGAINIFLYDIATATTTFVTKGSSGIGGNRDAEVPSISGDGSRITFLSEATDLVAGMTTNDERNIFLYDTASATTTLVTKGSSGIGGDGFSFAGAISTDGNRIAFLSTATDLIAGMTTSSLSNVYLYDAANDTITLVTKGSSGTGGMGTSLEASISGDGSKVVFCSYAFDLVEGMGINVFFNIFSYDVKRATTILVTLGATGNGADWESFDPSVSDNGTKVVFTSRATDLIPGMTPNDRYQIYLATLTTYADVTFDPDNEEATTTEKVLIGATVDEPTDPVKEGFAFDGWYTSAGAKWDFTDPIDDDMTLIAHWIEVFTITIDLQNGEDPITIEAVIGQPIAQPADPVRQGFIFDGWFTSDGIRWDFDDPITQDITLVAHWTVDEGSVVPDEPEGPEVPDIPQTGDILLLMSIAFMVFVGLAMGTTALLRRKRTVL